jgi:AcrR family transcriptional regulator
VQCLIEVGYAATSTPLVCERARLSRGALLHHFPTKTELVIAAVAHLAAKTGERVQAAIAARAGRKTRIGENLDVLWETFSGPLFYAALELWVAARTDPELHAHVYSFERALGKAIGKTSTALVNPTPERRAAYKDQIELTLHVLRGMALQKILRRDDSERQRLFALWKNMVAAALHEG